MRHRWPSEVEVAAVLEHGACNEFANAFAFETVAYHEAVECSSKHFLVRYVTVDGVGSSERNTISADNGHLANACFGHAQANTSYGMKVRRSGRGQIDWHGVIS